MFGRPIGQFRNSPIFILGVGRSGTTLLQRILNSYEDIYIWGEHDGFLKGLANSFFQVTESFYTNSNHFKKRLYGAKSIPRLRDSNGWQAWVNWFSKEDYRKSYTALVESLFCPSFLGERVTWGFKEIHYGINDRVIEFLSDLFPKARFIFIVRNGLKVIASQISGWRDTHQQMTGERWTVEAKSNEWVQMNSVYKKWHESKKINSFFIRFEDLVSRSTQALTELLIFIGKERGVKQEQIVWGPKSRIGAFFQTDDLKEHTDALAEEELESVKNITGHLNSTFGYKSA